MTFSGTIKAELCRVPVSRTCCAAAEAYGALLYSNTFTARKIRIVTGSPDFARRLPRLFQKAFGLDFDRESPPEQGGKRVLGMEDPEKIARIFQRFGFDPQRMLAHHINLGVLEEEHCRAAFLRGAFLAGGSMTDPEKRCHLELVTEHRSVSRETVSLLLEMGFEPRDTLRTGRYVLYFKQTEAIEDFFTAIGAPAAAMSLMSAKIEKDMRNSVNRRVNCDSANADKIVSASQSQLERIRQLDRQVGLQQLPRELRELALLRVANPEASLADLAQLSDPPLSKSGVNHRMRKLMRYPCE